MCVCNLVASKIGDDLNVPIMQFKYINYLEKKKLLAQVTRIRSQISVEKDDNIHKAKL